MKRKPSITLLSLVVLGSLIVTLFTNANAGGTVDHTLYTELLGKYVKNGVVSYRGFKNEEEKLDRYLQILENTATENLPHNERFAFYINAYNAWTIKLILSAYPGVKSIKDLGGIFKSPWKKKLCRINGDLVTLDYIEHTILRRQFKDPRVHFAINCASKGCPPLLSEAYLGSILDQQLDDATRAFVNDAAHNRLENDTLYLSKIFKWFAEDFNDDIYDFFLQYADSNLKKKLAGKKGKVKIKYLDYDWSLNGE